MKQKFLKIIIALLAVLAVIWGAATGQRIQPPDASPAETAPTVQTVSAEASEPSQTAPEKKPDSLPDVHGHYDSMRDVSLFIHLFGRLPDNYLTKAEARALGWEGGSLERYAPGCCIGGDTFRNSEGLLPDAPGRKWTECDIDTLGQSSRGAKRIVFSNDGLIYYTEDHYETFELIYGEP